MVLNFYIAMLEQDGRVLMKVYNRYLTLHLQ